MISFGVRASLRAGSKHENRRMVQHDGRRATHPYPGAFRADSRQTLAHLARFLQSLASAALRGWERPSSRRWPTPTGTRATAPPLKAALERAMPKAKTPACNRPLGILIADAQPSMRRFYWDAFSRSHHEVLGVARERQADITRYEAMHPDVILHGLGTADSDANDDAPSSGGTVQSCASSRRRLQDDVEEANGPGNGAPELTVPAAPDSSAGARRSGRGMTPWPMNCLFACGGPNGTRCGVRPDAPGPGP